MHRLLTVPILACALAASLSAKAAEPAAREPYGINLEGYAYPYPVQFIDVVNDGEALRMAYMDVPPSAAPNGRAVVLLHGLTDSPCSLRHFARHFQDLGYVVVAPRLPLPPILTYPSLVDGTVSTKPSRPISPTATRCGSSRHRCKASASRSRSSSCARCT